MRVALSKNGKEVIVVHYTRDDTITVRLALTILESQFSKIPNADAVARSLISQERRSDNEPNRKYIADVNNDRWIIEITPLF